MKIGVFDSGLGGLIITHSLIAALPQYDILYLGDEARVPYGDRPDEQVYQFTLQAVQYLFAQDCALIIVACNTASAKALRRIQQEVLPRRYPGRRVLGVLIPAAEQAVAVSRGGHIGVLATAGTVASRAFVSEVTKLAPAATVVQQSAPKLVPLIENGDVALASQPLKTYLAPLLAAHIDTLILGCTHYPVIKQQVRQAVGSDVVVISQDEVMPAKLADYLLRHPELDRQLSQTGQHQFLVTAVSEVGQQLARRLFGRPVVLRHVKLA